MISPATRVHLLAGATDMRRSFEDLRALAEALLETDPLSGHLFCFCNKTRTWLKVIENSME
jgi:transposase